MTQPTYTDKAISPRPRSRRAAAWKTGLVAAGLGTVVLGAGYFAGISVPFRNTAQASAGNQAAQASLSGQTIAPELSGNTQPFSFQRDDDGDRDFSGVRRFGFDREGVAPSLGQRQQQQPRFSGPITRSRGS